MPAVLTALAVVAVLAFGGAPAGAPPPLADSLQLLPASLIAPAGLSTRPATPSVNGPGATTAVSPSESVSAPVRLQVPSIGVDTTLVGLGLQPNGSLEVPKGAFPAGWYTGGPTPGALGPAVLAGHVNWNGTRGVFAELSRVSPGDEVTVTRSDRSIATFRVSAVQQVSKRSFPTGAVYGDLDHSGLRLITCGGTFSRAAGSYDDNVIVFADLVDVISA